jgi:hypothetical protein
MPYLLHHLAVAVLLLTIAGCAPGEAPDAAHDPVADTAAGIHPRSPDEIEQQAQPMTPQQAEELGVVDTTIQVTEEP